MSKSIRSTDLKVVAHGQHVMHKSNLCNHLVWYHVLITPKDKDGISTLTSTVYSPLENDTVFVLKSFKYPLEAN